MKINKLRGFLIISIFLYEAQCLGMENDREEDYTVSNNKFFTNNYATVLQNLGITGDIGQPDCVNDRLIVEKIRPIPENSPVNILSIDGGGVRGIIPAVFLNKLEERTGLKIRELFDLTVGTSTGAILSLGLTTRDKNENFRTADNMINIYTDLSAKVFPPKTWLMRPLPIYGFNMNLLYTIPSCFWWGSEYSEEPLERELKNILGDKELKDLEIPTVVTSVDVRHNSLKLFRSYRARWKDKDNFFVRDVARATSAAPTYFPMKKITYVNGNINNDTFSLVDGGMAANNPSVIALSEAYNLFKDRPINLVSLGTGNKSGYVNDQRDIIYMKRPAPTIGMLFDAQSHTVHTTLYALSQSIKELKYFRIQVPLQDELMPMDCANNVKSLREITEHHLDNNEQFNMDKVSHILKETIEKRI